MLETDFPCIKKYKAHKESPICNDCEIGRKGLCDVFIAFIKKYLKPLLPLDKPGKKGTQEPSALDKEIADTTVESIFKRFKEFRGREGYMEGAFYEFCKWEFKNRRIDVLRKKQSSFESESIISESNIIRDNESDSDKYSLVDGLTSRKSGQKRGGQFLPVVTDAISLSEQVLSELEEMALGKDHCAELVLEWYRYSKKELKQKEMARLRNEKENTFNKKLDRCFDEIRDKLHDRLNESCEK